MKWIDFLTTNEEAKNLYDIINVLNTTILLIEDNEKLKKVTDERDRLLKSFVLLCNTNQISVLYSYFGGILIITLEDKI